MQSVRTASDLAKEISNQTEKKIIGQLNDFISRDLIHVKMGEFSFVQEHDGSLTYKQTVELCLKDREYVEYLEEENKRLRELLKGKV